MSGGYFVDFTLKREQLARYGLTVQEAEEIIMSAVGGENVTTAIQGPERYGVNVRYARDYRDDLEKLQRVLVPTTSGAQIPLGAIADISVSLGPSMIRDENGMMAGYVYVDLESKDIGGYVAQAKQAVRDQLQLPPGYSLEWSGQFENMLRVRERLKVVIPLTILIIFVLLYLNTKSAVKAGIVMLAVPFSLIGAIWLLYFLGYNISIAVWVGMIALMGLDAETGVFMLLFLDLSYHERLAQGRLKTFADLKRGGDPRGGQAHPAQDHDGHGHVHGPDSHHVVHGHGVRRDEADRRPDDRRHSHELSAGAARLSASLCHLEMALRVERREGGDYCGT